MSKIDRTASVSSLFADPQRVTSVFALLSGAVVAVVAAAASYEHMATLAQRTGQGSMSAILPLSVDGMVVASSMALLAARRRAESPSALVYVALGLGLVVSVTANVLSGVAALPPFTSSVVAAWPPIALAISYELVLRACGKPSTAVQMVAEDPEGDTPGVTHDTGVTESDPVPCSARVSRRDQREQRVQEIAAQIATGHEVTGAAGAQVYDVSPRTGQRLVNDAEARVSAISELRLVEPVG